MGSSKRTMIPGSSVVGIELRIAGCDPCVPVLRVGDDIGEAACADREDAGGLVGVVLERVHPSTPVRAEDDVARRELLFARRVAERRPSADDEEHLLGAVVHVQPGR